MNIKKLICYVLLLLPFWSLSQKSYKLFYQGDVPIKAKKYEKKKFKDSLELLSYVEEMWLLDIKKSHPLASIDSLHWEKNLLTVHYFRGDKLENIRIFTRSEDGIFLKTIPGISERILLNLHFSSGELASVLKRILNHCQNNGYPFAKVGLDNVKFIDDELVGELSIDKGPFVSFFEIEIKGEAAVAKKYVCNYINIKEGDPYTEKGLRDITQRLAQMSFLSEIRAHEILFTPEGCKLYLYIKSNPVSLVNGIAGIQQDPDTDKTVITGDIRLKLQNTVKRGELLALNWRSLQPQTQELNIDFSFPFLFNTPFGVQSNFELYKQDSSFLTTNFNVGLQYFLSGGNYLNGFYERENSSILRSATGGNNFSNVSTNRYGLGFYRRRLDYIPNPSKGLILEGKASLGRRDSRVSDTSNVDVSTTFKLEFNLDAYLPITRRNVLRLYAMFESYYAEEIFENEAYRFGGLNSQRGFNEQALRATTYALFRAEYRFLLDKNSHVFAFFDQTIYENVVADYSNDTPYGFGAGFSFGSSIGIFSISYAVGKQLNNPVQLRDGKVHFGYIAYF